jgi:hypothetical protein
VEMELKLVSLVLGSNSSWIGNFNSLKKITLASRVASTCMLVDTFKPLR